MKSSLNPQTRGVLFVLAAVIIWSGWIVVSRYGVKGSLSAFDISAIRFFVAGTLFLPVLLKKGVRGVRYGWKGALFLALLMGATYNVVAISGMRFAPVSHAAAIINTTMLVCSSTIGICLLREKTTPLRLLGLGLSLLGIFCIFQTEHAGADAELWKGHLLFIIAGCMWAGYTLTVRAWRVEPLHATAIVSCFSLFYYLPLYALFIPSHIGLQNLNEVLFQCLYQGVINTAAFLSFNHGIALLGASRASSYMPLMPVSAALISIPALGEVPGTLEWLGIGIACIGVMLASGTVKKLWFRPAAQEG